MKSNLRQIIEIPVVAVLIAACAQIVIPIPGIPFTMQIFGICFALDYLGGKRATVCVILYIMLGLVGVPVFASFNSGVAALSGLTGGYIIGFVPMAAAYWLLKSVPLRETFPVNAGIMFLSLLLCYIFGTVWFMIAYAGKSGTVGFFAVLMKCVVPYVFPDVIKIILALKASSAVRRAMKLSR